MAIGVTGAQSRLAAAGGEGRPWFRELVQGVREIVDITPL
jgi:hypothetical protein